MSGHLQRLRSAYQRHGLATFRMAIGRVFPQLAAEERIDIYAQPLSAIQDSGTDWTVVRIDDQDDPLLTTLQAEFDCPAPARNADSRKECYVVLSAGAIVGYAWTTIEEFLVEEIGCVFTIPPDEFIIFDCLVREDHRGRGIYPAMLSAVMRDQRLRHPWLQTALIGVSSVNLSSRRGIVKAGFSQRSSITWETC